jgi:transmembrane sensor
MSGVTSKGSRPSPAACAQAAAWVARLHGPNRTREVEEGLRRWLAESPDHAGAFELLSDTWEKSARLRRSPLERVANWERVGFRMSFSRVALATACTFAMAVIATLLYLHTDAVTTGIGESRTLALEDGTRIHLNTDTRVTVRYERRFRQVVLDRGEAFFDVAKHPDRPFVVSAQGREIRALGTQFLVRAESQRLSITLVEGKVTVSGPTTPAVSVSENAGTAEAPPPHSAGTSSVVTLSPGERLTLASATAPRIDRPSIERVTAWERGQISFDNSRLADAVAEMNRYSRTPIVLHDPTLAGIRVSGIFEVGDSAYFAQAVSRIYHLRLDQGPGAILLTGENNEASVPGKDP